jgi:phage shock protein PspC (stress-responsive transcriptional regulator)
MLSLPLLFPIPAGRTRSRQIPHRQARPLGRRLRTVGQPPGGGARTVDAAPFTTLFRRGLQGEIMSLQSTSIERTETGESHLPESNERRLYRHPSAGQLGGVCAGIADSFGWDPTLVRVVWVVATLMTSGAGFLVYLLLWLLLPVGTQAQGALSAGRLALRPAQMPRIAVVLLALGGLWLLSNLGILPDMGRLIGFFVRVLFWPMLLMGVGYWLLRQADPQAVERMGAGLREAGAGLRHNAAAWREELARRRSARAWQATAPAAAQASANGAPAQGHAPTAQAARPLLRSRSDKMVLGVAGGMAQWLGMEPVLVRLVWALAILATAGTGLLLYIVAGVLIPLEPGASQGAAPATAAPAMADPDALQVVPIAPQTQTPQTPAPLRPVGMTPGDLPGEIVHL